MSLSDPELELLTELLREDPGADAYLQVGEELVRREHWPEAVRVLAGGLDAHPGEGGMAEASAWELMFKASVSAGQFLRGLAAWERLSMFAREKGPLRKLRVRALAMSGQIDLALDTGETYLRDVGFDQDVWELIERLSAPLDDDERRGIDPFVTAERAEDYVMIGRPDRAIRLYRRILHRNPQAVAIARRLRELLNEPVDAADDLSEELTGEMELEHERPPILMPTPNLAQPSIQAIEDAALGLDLVSLSGSITEEMETELEIPVVDRSSLDAMGLNIPGLSPVDAPDVASALHGFEDELDGLFFKDEGPTETEPTEAEEAEDDDDDEEEDDLEPEDAPDPKAAGSGLRVGKTRKRRSLLHRD